jgi:hypothetical protein
MDDIIQKLEMRLPELEWKLSELGAYINHHRLPKGLFSERLELTPKLCIDEIKQDLYVLRGQTNERSINYKVLRVNQKINVLVRLCKTESNKKNSKNTQEFSVQALSTRQQWLKSVEQEIANLQTQREALKLTLCSMELKQDVNAILKIKLDIGDLERRLSVLSERSKILY